MASHDELIRDFVALTNSSPSEAQQYLATNQWDLNAATTEWYTALDEGIERAQEGTEDPQEPEAYTGPRTLDGRPAPQAIPSVGSSSRTAPPPRRSNVATLGSIAPNPLANQGPPHAHADDDDDSDDEDYEPEETPRDLFAGGEKSGLAVQDPSNRNDPRKVVNDILKKARANATRTSGESSTTPPSRFRGSGQTLGGDDTPSQIIPDPNPRAADPGPTQTRILHLWNDGFSVEDGPLRRFDDARNAADLNMIRQGRAPLHLMGVQLDQPVDVQLIKHDENYKAPPKTYKPFSGGGHRLGSPTPGPSSESHTLAPVATTSSPSTTPEVNIDSSQPTIPLRIQLADGTRLPVRFNTTQTVGDLYDFIERASRVPDGRSWVVATTFPNKDHTDKSLRLGDMAEFKRGGTAVQKWT